MKTVVSVTVAATFLSGCSGMIAQYYNKPIQKDRLHELTEASKIMAIGGDYRIARVQLDRGVRRENDGDYLPSGYQFVDGRWTWVEPDTTQRYDVCAETQADAIFTRSAKSDLSATDEVLRPGTTESTSDLVRFIDESIQNATETYNRTEVSDVVRHLSWQWCNARMNGDITASEYHAGLTLITTEAFTSVRANTRNPDPNANDSKQEKLSPPPPPPPPPSPPPPPPPSR